VADVLPDINDIPEKFDPVILSPIINIVWQSEAVSSLGLERRLSNVSLSREPKAGTLYS
jgi:hypothetical protein